MAFAFKLCARVNVPGTDDANGNFVQGLIIARTEYHKSEPSYRVRFVSANAAEGDQWFDESAVSAVNPAPKTAAKKTTPKRKR